MAYFLFNQDDPGVSGFGCGPGCSCAPCRRDHVTLGQRYVADEEHEQEPAHAPAMGEFAEIGHCPSRFERRASRCASYVRSRASRMPRGFCRVSVMKMFCPRL